MCQVIDVKSARRNVGRHEQLHRVLAEFLHRLVSLRLRQVAVKRLCIVAILYEFVGNLLCLELRAAEDDGVDFGVEVHKTLQCEVLVLGMDEVIHVVHVLGTFVSRTHDNLLVCAEVAFRHLLHLLAHGGGEQQFACLSCAFVSSGQCVEDVLYVVLETHVEHLVRLVEHYGLHIVQFCHAAVFEIDESTGCCHDDLGAVAQCADLLVHARAAINRHDADVLRVLRKVVQVV